MNLVAFKLESFTNLHLTLLSWKVWSQNVMAIVTWRLEVLFSMMVKAFKEYFFYLIKAFNSEHLILKFLSEVFLSKFLPTLFLFITLHESFTEDRDVSASIMKQVYDTSRIPIHLLHPTDDHLCASDRLF